jgi:hypothetical protein
MQQPQPRVDQAEDAIAAWRRSVQRQEAEFAEQRAARKAAADAKHNVDWDAIINERVNNMKSFVLDVLGEALKQSFELERNAYIDALKSRDTKINQLEAEIAKQAVTISKLEVKIIELGIARDRNGNGKLVDVSPQLKVVN